METTVLITFAADPKAGIPVVARVESGPLGIWGPTDPRPTPPIALPPGWASGNPPGIWGPPGPWPTPPIAFPPGWVGGVPPVDPGQPPMEPHSAWRYEDGGWYFVSGPYPRPRPLACVARTAADDPIKGKWTLMSDGWYFVAGPFDKPFPICDTEPPDVPTEPPTEPPTGASGEWKYDNGWYFCYGPLDKPQPMPPGGGSTGGTGQVPPE